MDYPPPELRIWFQNIAIAFLVFASWRWGGGPERLLAGVLAWFRIGDWINHAVFGPWADLAAVDTGHVVIDGVGLAVAVFVALYANRWYPLWFAALQLIVLASHLALAVTPGIAPLAFYLIYLVPSYLQIMLVAGGTWAHRRRVRRHGIYRSWRTFSPRSPAAMRSNSPGG